MRMTSLHRAVAMTTLISCVLAHSYRYRAGYMFNRQQPIEEKRNMDRQVSRHPVEIEIDCPVCPNDEACLQQISGRFVKVCKHGVFKNKDCNNRSDCYKGAGEYCNEDLFQVCQPGLRCVDYKCEGVSLTGRYYSFVPHLADDIYS